MKFRSLKKNISSNPEEKYLTHEEMLEIAEQRQKENAEKNKEKTK